MPNRLFKCCVKDGCGEMLSRKEYFDHKTAPCCNSATGNAESDCGDNIEMRQAAEKQQQFDDATQFADEVQRDAFTSLMLSLLKWQTVSKVSDRCMLLLIHTARLLLLLLGAIFDYDILRQIAGEMPQTIITLKRNLGLINGDFVKMVACFKCHTVYDYSRIKEERVKQRGNVRWPNHPRRSKRLPCNSRFIRKVEKPLRVYVLYPIQKYLTRFSVRPGFIEGCNRWKVMSDNAGTYEDIYNGKLWQDQSQYLQSAKTNLAGLLNIDWFQPYKQSPYSVGAIYMVILNLPRSERFKLKNIMLLGVIPGPNEPSVEQMNCYIQPIVNELLQLNVGIKIMDNTRYGNVYRFRLLGLSCDLPATRKIGGFLSSSANQGCSKCKKTFTRIQTSSGSMKANYSGFDRQSWTLRTGAEHKAKANKITYATYELEMNGKQKATGCRWSSLFDLPYYDPIRGQAVDPMHCLYLGIAKKMTKHYFSSGLLTADELKMIQQTVNMIRVPATVGRLPRKIASGLSSFTADQWKSWTLIYSTVVLKPYLPKEHYDIWLIFVRAVLLLSRKLIDEELEWADDFIHQFATQVEAKYGAAFCTPNLHMACHLKECIQDYGPLYAFWCYSFERYNGILANYNFSSSDITTQMLKRFLEDQTIVDAHLPMLEDELGSMFNADSTAGTLSSIAVAASEQAKVAFATNVDLSKLSLELLDTEILLPDRLISKYLEQSDYQCLKSMVHSLLPTDISQSYTISRRVRQLEWIIYRGETFRVHKTERLNCNVVRARWLSSQFPLQIKLDTNRQRVGVIRRIIIAKISNVSVPASKKIILLDVSWFSDHHSRHAFGRHAFGRHAFGL